MVAGAESSDEENSRSLVRIGGRKADADDDDEDEDDEDMDDDEDEVVQRRISE